MNRMTFWDHIDELRHRIFKSIFVLVLSSIFSYSYSNQIISILLSPLETIDMLNNIQVLSITTFFLTKVLVSIISGILFSLPFIMYQIWVFVQPLFTIKKSNSFMLLTFSLLFSLFGFLFAYFVIIPNSLYFFTSISNNDIAINYNFTLDGYISYVCWILLGCCLLFQLPIVTIFGCFIGLFTTEFLKQYRRLGLVLFMVVSAVITPPDPVSQLFVFFPLAILYEFSILISRMIKKKW